MRNDYYRRGADFLLSAAEAAGDFQVFKVSLILAYTFAFMLVVQLIE